jgi:hypothetical protein
MANGGTYRRDPLSEGFDAGARRLLERAYSAAPGTWTGTLVADPSPLHRVEARRLGIDLDAADPAKQAVGTRLNRWAAAFERALYYQHRWYFTAGRLSGQKRTTAAVTRALQVEWGRRKPALGVIPAGRPVRVRLRPGGQAALRAVGKMDDDDRIYLADGDPGGKWGDPDARDWA